jgi:protein SCO1/2
MKIFRIVFVIMATILGGLSFWLWQEASRQRSAMADAPFGVPFQLVAQDGKPVSEQAFRGKPTALFFGYTHCPEICPTTVYELSGWMNTVDPGKKALQAYFVTIDPERDTPDVLGTFLSNATDRIIGISGDPKKVEDMARGFKVYFKKVPSSSGDPTDYTMDHTASVFLLDSLGRFSGTISYGESADVAVEKLKNLIASN